MISFVLTHNKKRPIHLAFTICLFKNALWNICKKFANFLCWILDYSRLWCKLDASKKEYYLCAFERVNHEIHLISYNKLTADGNLENFRELHFFISKDNCFIYLNSTMLDISIYSFPCYDITSEFGFWDELSDNIICQVALVV